MPYLPVMNSLIPLLLGASLLVACGNGEVIVQKAPYENLRCEPVSWEQLNLESIKFARLRKFQFSSAEFSVLLTNQRLNFILTRVPDTGEIYAIAIARSKPSDAEQMIFQRFVASLHLKCGPAAGSA